MVCSGLYRKISSNKIEEYSLIYKVDGKDVLVYLGKDNNIVSAYKIKSNKKYAFRNKDAEQIYDFIKTAFQGATSKNGTPVPFKYGAGSMHYFKKRNIDYEVQKFNGELVHLIVSATGFNISLDFYEGDFNEVDLDYTEIKVETISNVDVDDVPVRSLDEIALEKDISWLKDKKYYIVNDNETAEHLFSQLEKYKGIVCLDYETTGLKINMFGRYGSKRRAELENYNLENPDSPIRTDSVVGLIFCVEDNVSYYFPVGHRKFDNLYSKRDETCIKTIQNIKARYTVGDLRDDLSEYSVFIRNLPESEFTPDIILMERVRDILEKCNILAHNGSFEYKVSLLYNIDLNLKEDTMLMHQLMYKFRSTTSNKGEPSNLKYLTKVEFGIDQLDLKDFFVNYKEDNKGTVRNTKSSTIDFSYMDYEGTKAYGPADGDFTLQLYKIYGKDLKSNHKDMEYIYNVEVVVSMAIGYMEFYGLRIDEEKIEKARNKSVEDMMLLEHKIRKIANYTSPKEDDIYSELMEAINNKESTKDKKLSLFGALREEIDNSSNILNLNSPAQVSGLFYDILKYPCKDGDRSVGKKVIKSLTKAKNSDGSPKYPAVGLYREYKDLSSLVTKFFGKLPDFMYPGGFFFSSFGQISTATGRMSCLDEDTLVTTVGGVKKIKDIKVGDLVYCYDDSGDIRIKPVLNVIYKGYKDCVELTYKKSKSKTTNKLVCTPDHKIKTRYFGWKEAKDCINKKVYHYSDKSNVYLEDCKVVSIAEVGKRNVYDLEIAGIHNFIANEICVHNCSRPNSQQLPKSVTKIIIPRDNYIISDADFSQIEYRTMTALAMEAHLIEQFRDPDSDFHTIMASVMYQVPYASVTPEMRGSAKSFNFGIPYGMGLKSLSILLFGDSTLEHVEKAKELYELYFKDQPNIRKFFERAKETASVYKFNTTYFNRVRAYSFVDAEGKFSEAKKAMALRQAGNFIIQGCLSGDTIIQTKEYGFTKIENVANCGERLHIWDGNEWTKGDVLYSGKKRKCIITLNDDRKIVCSPNHKFLVVYEDESKEFVKCEHLVGADKSSKPHRIVVNKLYAFENSSVEPVIKGFVNKDIDSLYVKTVEITDEEIGMYDIYNTDRGYFVADGVITHNSSADIFKIAVARNFSFIRRNKLFGKILITNMVHDEMLFEIDCDCINIKKALAEIIKNMEFKLEGFPPLYVGAGVEMSWANAKGKMAEIHPVLANTFIDEAEKESLYVNEPNKNTDIRDYFNDRLYKFRVNKIIDYLKDENNHNKEVSPIIGNLLSLQFDYGVNKEFDSEYTEENGYSKAEIELHKKNIPLEQLKRFIADKEVDIDPGLFKGATIEVEEEKDVAYDDGEDNLDEDDFESASNHIFALIEEDTNKYGISIQDLIKEFGLFVSVEMSVCGIDLKKVSKSKKEELYSLLDEHECSFDDEGALQVVFLGANNNLVRTGIYVNNLRTVDVADRLHINTLIA
jgi:DNA-directed DNA polymerase